MSMTVEALERELTLIGVTCAGTYKQLAAGILPFIERHIAAGQQGAGDKPSRCMRCGWEGPLGTGHLCKPVGMSEQDARFNNRHATPKPACPCNLATCVEPWEPGCGLGTSEEHVRVAKPAGAVPLPTIRAYAEIRGTDGPDVFDEKLWAWMKGMPVPEGENITLFCALDDAIRYGDAREAAGRADAVPAGLGYVMTLVDAASPGPWLWSENGNIVPEQYADDCEIAAVYSERDDDGCPINASAIIAAVNWLRENGRTMLAAPQQMTTQGEAVGYVTADGSVVWYTENLGTMSLRPKPGTVIYTGSQP